jgi:homocitrate synthase
MLPRKASLSAATVPVPQIAMQLDKMRVDYIELANPAASDTALQDLKAVMGLGLDAKVLTHIRCAMHDADLALQGGVDGVNMYMATSPILAKHSHGKAIDEILKTAEQVIRHVQSAGKEVRFSCEDTFRSRMDDVLLLYKTVGELGVNRVGIADTVGIATPLQVQEVVQRVRAVLPAEVGIEFHTHNDTGCCISNALMALLAGATHIDTCVLGIGERNGITPLGGFLARLYTLDQAAITKRYNLKLIAHLEKYVSQVVGSPIPFNNYVTGSCAFTHKAGVHTKAVIANPTAYEIINPEDFGVPRRIQLTHRLTGWNAMAARAQELSLTVPVEKLKSMTTVLKNLSEERQFTTDELDRVLISLAAGPRERQPFLTVGASSTSSSPSSSPSSPSAASSSPQTLAEDVMAAVEASIRQSAPEEEARPYVILQFVGHLFDKLVVNTIIDLAVDSPCDYRVLSLNPAKRNELLSSITIKLTADDAAVLELTKEKMQRLATVYEATASCILLELGKHSAAPSPHAKCLEVTGHLFDKALFNRILDILVVSNVDFEVLRLLVGRSDDQLSTCTLRLSHPKAEIVERVAGMIQRAIDGLRDSGALGAMAEVPCPGRAAFGYIDEF